MLAPLKRCIKYAWPLRDYQLVRILNMLTKKLPMRGSLIILDLGCGNGTTCARFVCKSVLKHRMYRVVGVDINPKNLRKAKRIFDNVVLADASRPPFRPKCFDLILMIEVLDHLPKQNGLNLLEKELDRLTRHAVLITCPNGSTSERTLEQCMWDRHNSDWLPSELMKFWYNVIGIIPKTLATIFMKLLKKPFLLLQILFPIFILITLPPHISWQLIAWKKVEGNDSVNQA